MTVNTLFIGLEQERKFFPFARVDKTGNGEYKFRYTKGLPGFSKCFKHGNPFELQLPEKHPYLISNELYPMLDNMIMNKRRADYNEYLDELDLLGKNPSDFEILAVSNGKSVTNNFEAFPLLEKDKNGKISCQFMVRQTGDNGAHKAASKLKPGDELYFEKELKDGVEPAVKVMTIDGNHHIGYTPRYLAEDYFAAIDHNPKYNLKVIKVSPALRDPVLVSMTASINGHIPMSAEEYQTYV